jgi:hypothetical protein
MAGLLALGLAAAIAVISVPQLRTMLTAASSAGSCAASAAAGPAGATASRDAAAGPAVVDGSAVADNETPPAPDTTAQTGASGGSGSGGSGSGGSGSNGSGSNGSGSGVSGSGGSGSGGSASGGSTATPAVATPAAAGPSTAAANSSTPGTANTGSPGTAPAAAPTSTGSDPTPSSAPDPAPSAPASATPCPSPSASASATATAPAVNPEAGIPDLAEADPVDPAGNAISLNQSAVQAANTLNCTLIVPDHPLRAGGLATPWQLSDGCSEANPNEAAFVEASILPPNGQLMVYNPLVITQGTTPAATPPAPKIPLGSRVIVEVGFNGNNLVLEGAGATQGRCIDAFGNSIVAQTSACNARRFFAAANLQIARGTLKIPALGMANDGQTCESTHSFSLIDQDQSDNVDSEYLLNVNGQTAQDSAANKAAMGSATVISNGSDEGLLDRFVDPALGCTPPQATDLTSANGVSGSQALNELSARQNQQVMPALLPVNDPQLLVAGQFSIGKTNTYRMLTDQPLIPPSTNKNQMAAMYCQEMVNIGPAKLQRDEQMETGFTTPVPATGDNLATFMGARLAASFTNLGCQNFGLTNPVTVTTDGNGVATAVTYNTAQQQAQVPQAMSGGNGRYHHAYNRAPVGRHGHKENGAGM